ncbi:T-cell receptor beta chain V region CTL-L17 Precursor [Channa argus]|nr:T-cell receptor beta chain V region CTL-L17 Precursor [Channa argus]
MAHMTSVKSSSVRQESHFISAKTGQNVTLQCFYDGDMATRFYWYKQTVGQEPRLVSTSYKYESNGIFHDEFNNNPRFILDTEKGKHHLEIRDIQISDSATYFCASSHSYMFEFGDGTTVSVTGSGLHIPALVHQSVSETIQPGDSVTLNCTVQTGTCDGEHSVYWFRNSRESLPQLIYIHGSRDDHCEKKPKTQTQTCFYNLPMKTLNLSHLGNYYCAVISCGHILFGNGTKLDVEVGSRVSVYFLSGALALTTTLSVLLMLLLCSINKRKSCQWTEANATFATSSTANAEVHQNEENIHYAALQKHDVYRSRRQRKSGDSECVYSSIKQ